MGTAAVFIRSNQYASKLGRGDYDARLGES